jgi:hypothetical protein
MPIRHEWTRSQPDQLGDVAGVQFLECRGAKQAHRASNLLRQDFDGTVDTRFASGH